MTREFTAKEKKAQAEALKRFQRTSARHNRELDEHEFGYRAPGTGAFKFAKDNYEAELRDQSPEPKGDDLGCSMSRLHIY